MIKNRVIGVDLGGTNLRVGLIKRGKVLWKNRVKTPKNGKELFEVLCEEIEKFDSWNVRGIGVASPGPLKNGKLLNPPNLPLENFDLEGKLRKRFNKKVKVENDANCVALAEIKYGAGKKHKNFIVLTLGTGIGGGIIINGELYRGKGNGGELGHIIIQDGKDMEYWAGYNGQVRRTKKEFGRGLKVIDLMEMKTAKAKKSIDETADYLGRGIASLIHCFDPEIIVLNGGVKETGKEFLMKIKKKVRKYRLFKEETPIVWSSLEDVGMLGASTLV